MTDAYNAICNNVRSLSDDGVQQVAALVHALAHAETDTQAAIIAECSAIRDVLLAKNRSYGNSATDPVRIFSKADPAEQIRVRLDDKLSRLARGQAAGEDVVLDLLGYLVLLRVMQRRGT